MFLPLNFRVLLSIVVFMIGFSLYLIYRDSQPKSEYNKVVGRIEYIDSRLGELPNRHFGKYRYILLNNYSYPFEIFIGKDFGDFKPKFEKLDSLKVGDIVTVYGYEDSDLKANGINRSVQFIDKDEEVYFERGNKSKYVGFGIITISIFLVLFGFIALRKKKIPY